MDVTESTEMKSHPVIPDPSVLNTFAATTLSPLSVYGQEIAPIYVLDSTLNSENAIAEDDCNELGLRIFVVAASQYAQAGEFHGDISFDECVCVAVAVENDWTILTDDPVLKRTCRRECVSTCSTLQILRTLTRSRLIPKLSAKRVARHVLRRCREIPEEFDPYLEELALTVPT